MEVFLIDLIVFYFQLLFILYLLVFTMNINIFGSTGVIGKKTLELIDKNFPNIKINLFCAKSNLKLLKKQINKYKPKYAFLYDHEKI